MSYEVVVMEMCSSWHSTTEVASDREPTTRYRVSFSGPEGGTHCDCPGFKYRGDCKHVTRAYRAGCMWHQQWCDETLETPGTCPRCGDETIPCRVAV